MSMVQYMEVWKMVRSYVVNATNGFLKKTLCSNYMALYFALSHEL